MQMLGPVQMAEANGAIAPLSVAHQDSEAAVHQPTKVENAGFSQLLPAEHDDLPRKGWRFWTVFPPLCLSQLLIALETSIPTASLPKISSDLDAGDNWVWIVNAYLLTK